MNDQLNYYLFRLQSLPFKTKALLVLILNIVLVYYYYDTSIGRMIKEIDALKTQKISKEQEYKDLLALKTQFPELQDEIDKLTENLQQKLRKLPNDSELPALLKTISKEAIRSGLKIITFMPEKEVVEGYFVMIPISIQAEGSYHQMALFCDKVSKLPRIVNITNTKLGSPRSELGRSILTISFQLQAFRFKERIPIKQDEPKEPVKEPKGQS